MTATLVAMVALHQKILDAYKSACDIRHALITASGPLPAVYSAVSEIITALSDEMTSVTAALEMMHEAQEGARTPDVGMLPLAPCYCAPCLMLNGNAASARGCRVIAAGCDTLNVRLPELVREVAQREAVDDAKARGSDHVLRFTFHTSLGAKIDVIALDDVTAVRAVQSEYEYTRTVLTLANTTRVPLHEVAGPSA